MALRIGSWGTPEFGITEAIQRVVAPSKSYTGSGGSNLMGPTTSVSAPNNYSYSPAPMQSTNTGTTSQTYTGGTGGTTSRTVAQQPQQAPNTGGELSAPSQPDINWDEVYAPAFDALNQAEQATQSGYQSDVGQAQSEYGRGTADLQTEQAARMANFGEQRQGETKRTEGAISEARRMAAQLLQGLQSQYGGSTGTGAFRGEQLGAAATQNISGNREALQTALTGIARSESALKDKVMGLQKDLDFQLQDTKAKLKANLDQALAQIAGSRGGLAADKGAKRYEALNNYQNQLMQVDQINTARRQQLADQAAQQAQKIIGLKQSVQDKYSANLKAANLSAGQQFNVGGTTYMPVPTQSGGIEYLKGATVDEGGVQYDENGNPII